MRQLVNVTKVLRAVSTERKYLQFLLMKTLFFIPISSLISFLTPIFQSILIELEKPKPLGDESPSRGKYCKRIPISPKTNYFFLIFFFLFPILLSGDR